MFNLTFAHHCTKLPLGVSAKQQLIIHILIILLQRPMYPLSKHQYKKRE